MLTATQGGYAARHEKPLAIDGIQEVAKRLTRAFGDRAIEVAERWAKESDVRYRAVANLLKTQKEQR
jgi:hypothetical protein